MSRRRLPSRALGWLSLDAIDGVKEQEGGGEKKRTGNGEVCQSVFSERVWCHEQGYDLYLSISGLAGELVCFVRQ